MQTRRFHDVPSAAPPPVLAGTLDQRPPAGMPGRLYISTPVFTASTGTSFPVAAVDSGTAWTSPKAVVYRNRTVRTVQSKQVGVSGGDVRFWSDGIVKGGTLGSGRALRIDLRGSWTFVSAGTVIRPLLFWGTTGTPALAQSFTATAAGTARARLTVLIAGGNHTATQYLVMLHRRDGKNNVVAQTTAAVDSTVSQRLLIAVSGTLTGLAQFHCSDRTMVLEG